MSVKAFRDIIIPAIKQSCGIPIYEADHSLDSIDGPHATYKVTMSYGKGVGRPDQTFKNTDDGLELEHFEEYRTTVSITTYAFDDLENGIFDRSEEMAQQIYDWFEYEGYELLDRCGIVVISKTDVTNRDAIIVEEYERRHGFDVIMRMTRKMSHKVDYFDGVRTRYKKEDSHG